MHLGQDYVLTVDLLTTSITDIVIEMKKPNDISFTELTLEESDFTEAAYGYYNILIRKELLDQIGTYVFRLSRYETEIFVERECTTAPLNSSLPPDVCIVMGNVRNASARIDAFEHIEITAKPLHLPVSTEGTLIMGRRVITYTDYSGFFQLPLIKGMHALIEIPDVGVRFQAEIPNIDSVRIEDLIP